MWGCSNTLMMMGIRKHWHGQQLRDDFHCALLSQYWSFTQTWPSLRLYLKCLKNKLLTDQVILLKLRSTQSNFNELLLRERELHYQRRDSSSNKFPYVKASKEKKAEGASWVVQGGSLNKLPDFFDPLLIAVVFVLMLGDRTLPELAGELLLTLTKAHVFALSCNAICCMYIPKQLFLKNAPRKKS